MLNISSKLLVAMVANYFVLSLSAWLKVCGSFERYADVSLVLANNCFNWGSIGLDGDESNPYEDDLLYNFLIKKDVDTVFLERMIINISPSGF